MHAKTDPIVPFANSEAYYAACRKAGVAAEFLALEHGTHAFGLAASVPGSIPDSAVAEPSTWPAKCVHWMDSLGLLEQP